MSGVLRAAAVGKLTSKMRASSECGLEALKDWVYGTSGSGLQLGLRLVWAGSCERWHISAGGSSERPTPASLPTRLVL